MIDEKKLRERLAEILKSPTYRGLHSFAIDPLVNDIVNAVKECKETEEEEREKPEEEE
ncbi:MAG: hypothetical protein OEZ27_05530 [Nitrospinota bacterium]|nr:hypothetical protein [Nitrospinota bacterium]